MNNNLPEQLSKKERRALRREEKQQFQTNKQRKRSAQKMTTWAALIFTIALIGYGFYWLASQPEKQRPGEAFANLGQQHIAAGASHDSYNSNPPTSGPHYSQPANWGIYQQELPDEQLIHNLEHGGIWISYKDIDEETKSNLEAIGKKYSGSVIVTPRAANDAKIVLASWRRLEKFESFDEERIKNFIKANKNKSPEPFAR